MVGESSKTGRQTAGTGAVAGQGDRSAGDRDRGAGDADHQRHTDRSQAWPFRWLAQAVRSEYRCRFDIIEGSVWRARLRFEHPEA